jgi:Icc-related predicted phosphoesterase
VFPCAFATDLHGRVDRWETLIRAVEADPPRALFLGGDLLPSGLLPGSGPAEARDFAADWLFPNLERVARTLGPQAPRVFAILGNDDGRFEEPAFLDAAERGLLGYAHGRRADLDGYVVYGYAYVPPTPFLLKDWERYDVSRYVDPGCVSPEEGWRTVRVDEAEAKHATIADDLARLTEGADLSRAVFLFHAPPHATTLDRAALDEKMVDHVPLDVHVGSIAIRRFVEERQPLVTLHGHVHESARLTGRWRDRIGRTHLFGAAHDGPELALVRFDLDAPERAERALL